MVNHPYCRSLYTVHFDLHERVNHHCLYMLPVSLVLRTIVTWVDLKDRIGIRPPVYCMRCLCFITQASFLPAFFQATQHKQISLHLLLIAQLPLWSCFITCFKLVLCSLAMWMMQPSFTYSGNQRFTISFFFKSLLLHHSRHFLPSQSILGKFYLLSLADLEVT